MRDFKKVKRIDPKHIKDSRKFEFGSIWQVRDALINLPNIDRTMDERKYHFSRCAVIIDNSEENFNEDSLTILTAPISHRVDCKRKFDIDLYPDSDSVKENSIIMVDYIQPILKVDLYKCVGNISNDKKYELFDMIMAKLGIDTKEESATTKNEDK